ncbi:MAG TPA: PP2C family serine/threonine-protein phosphatase [Bacteroidales bacterium]|nr:PP2C family serine/threonine-protein phosphatase [Bacteroidales bacterium]
MTTRKLKNFEFAGQTLSVEASQKQIHVFDAFETPNGFVFLVSGSDRLPEGQEQVCNIASQRARYYLENELTDDPIEAVRNALVYVNGYIYELGRKQAGFVAGHACLLCVLVRDKKAYYSWVGDVHLYFFNGKKLYPFIVHGKEKGAENEYLGVRQLAVPAVCDQAFVPVNNDVLLLASGSAWNEVREKVILGVLTDNMPTTTKVQKLVKLAGTTFPYCHLSAMMVSFYNLEEEKSGDPKSLSKSRSPRASVPKNLAGAPSRPVNQNVKIFLVILGILALSYMIYDLFLFDPETDRTQDTPVMVTPQPVEMPLQEQAETVEAPAQVPLPEDISYNVRRGDTWGRIYQQFEVCSWFIRNHPPNAGKFDTSGNPVFNTVLMIPVIYSGSQTLNPAFYGEFSTEKVGSACQNANEAFLNRFKARIRQGN